MKLEEAVQFFDRQLPIDSAWLVIGGVRIGVPYCCDCPVVENSQGLFCFQCGREIKQLGRQWVVSNWGRKGINLLRLSAPLQVEAARAMAQSTIPENLDVVEECSSGGGADSGHCDDAEALRAEVDRLRSCLCNLLAAWVELLGYWGEDAGVITDFEAIPQVIAARAALERKS